MTNYVILYRLEAENEWRQVTAITARSARSAIAQAVKGDENPYTEGTFIAVPARSWRQVTVSPETKTVLRFS